MWDIKMRRYPENRSKDQEPEGLSGNNQGHREAARENCGPGGKHWPEIPGERWS